MKSKFIFLLKLSLLVTIASCRRLTEDKRSEDFTSYHIPTVLDRSLYEIPDTLVYNSDRSVQYWPPNNTPTLYNNVPTLYNNVPVLNVNPMGIPLDYVPLYSIPSVPHVYYYGNTPVGNVPNALIPPVRPNIPNGIIPPGRPNVSNPPPKFPPQGRPAVQPEDDERREPLEPNSDGVIDPEVGLKQRLVKLGPTMFGGTFDLDNMRFDGFSSWMKLLNSKQWWKGSNVCVEREEKIIEDEEDGSESKLGDKMGLFFSGNIMMQTCVEYPNKYECTTKEHKLGKTKIMTETYHCCHGSQLKNKMFCAETELLPLIETIRKLNGTEFLAISHDVSKTLQTENITVFLPSNEAFEKFSDMMLLTNQIELFADPARRRRAAGGVSPSDLVLNHLVEGFHDISPDETFFSMYKNYSLQIRDSKMVNCAKIGKSVHATNGIVHTIDRVLMPITRNISEILRDRSEFSILNNLLNKTGLLNDVADDEIWTLFAPTNAAFEKLDAKVLEKIMRADGCTKNLLKYHMFSQPLCSSEVTQRFKMVNSIGDYVRFSLPKNDEENSDNVFNTNSPSFMIDHVKVTKPDILATNGIIHAIDEVIIPESAASITSLLQEKNLTKFYSLIKKADMEDEIQTFSNVTFFAPTDKAFDHFVEEHGDRSILKAYLDHDEEVDGPMSDLEKKSLRLHLLNYISKGSTQSCGFQDNGFLTTLNNDAKLRMNLYSTLFVSNTYNRATVHCARLLHFDNQQCDNILHQIDRPLIMHEGNVLDQINYIKDLSMLNKILPGTDSEKLLMNADDITFLAPTNEAFELISKADYEELLTNKKMVDTILKQHILRDVTCCSGMSYIPWPFTSYLKAYNDVQLEMRNKQIGNAPIKSCDHVASNGVMHLTNKIMIPIKINQGNRKTNFDILLFGLH